METDKFFFVGEVVEIIRTDGASKGWIGFQATVRPWPENEEQYEDGILNNWLSPNSNRPDGFEMMEFAWPAQSLKRVE